MVSKDTAILYLIVLFATIINTCTATLTCSSGTTQIGGINSDIGGCGLEGCNSRYQDHYASIEDCADGCRARPDCKSFTWAATSGDQYHPGQTVCTLYNSDIPNQRWCCNQIMCKPITTSEPTTTSTTNEPTQVTTDEPTQVTTASIYPYQKVSIEIDCVPEHGAGASSWGMITGVCNCVNVISNTSEIACDQSNIFIDWSTSYSVVIYSVTNKYYIQPYYDDYYTTISDSGLWSRRIHLGYGYEVDLVPFEDKSTVINTDSRDATGHDPECISGSAASNNPSATHIYINPPVNSGNKIEVNNVSLFSVFLMLMVLLMS